MLRLGDRSGPDIYLRSKMIDYSLRGEIGALEILENDPFEEIPWTIIKNNLGFSTSADIFTFSIENAKIHVESGMSIIDGNNKITIIASEFPYLLTIDGIDGFQFSPEYPINVYNIKKFPFAAET